MSINLKNDHLGLIKCLSLVKDLKKLALTEEYEGRYQILIREVLQVFVSKNKSKKKMAI